MSLQNVLYFLMWAGLFVVMMRFGCGSHIMGHGHGSEDGSPIAPGTDVDPVCRMTVQTASAKTSAYQGRIYHFCSQNCREKFEAAPATYAKQMTTGLREGEHHHGC